MTARCCHLRSSSLRSGIAMLGILMAAWSLKGLPQSGEPGNLPQVVRLIERGKLVEAEAELQAALQRDPGSSTIYRMLGFVYQRQQRFQKAENALEESLRLSRGNNPEALFLLAQTKFALKKPQEAIVLTRQLSSLSINDPQTQYALGRLLRENGQQSEALPELERAHSLAPHDPAITTELIIAAREHQNSNKADTLLQSLLRTATYRDLVQAGSRLGEAGQLGLAIPTFQRAVELQADGYDAKFDLAFAYLRQGQYPEAMDILNKIPGSQSEGRPDYHYLRGKVELALQHPEAAGAQYALALHQQPDNESLCIDAGVLYLKFEDFRKALNVFESCATRLPDSVPIETGLGLTYFQLGKYPDATGVFRKVVDLRPGDDAAREALAFVLYITSSLREARQLLEPRLASPDVDYYVPYLYALVLLRLDARANRPRALQSLEKSIKLNPKFAPGYFQRGKMEWETGDAARALKDLELATHLDPEYAEPYYLMAQIYFRQGRKGQADQARQRSLSLNREREETEQKRDLENRLFRALR